VFVVCIESGPKCAAQDTNCPPGTFLSKTDFNVARMCGPEENEACPAQLTSVSQSYIGSNNVLMTFVASNGNDGNTATTASTSQSNSLINHVFSMDFGRSRNIQAVEFFNRKSRDYRSIGVTLRIGSSPSWNDNEICATLNDGLIQTYTCNLIGRYMFLVLPAEIARGSALNFNEISAFLGNCTTCPIYSSSLANSLSIKDCFCDPGYTGQNGEVCTVCPLGTNKPESGRHACKCNADSYAINDISGLLLRHTPYIVSDAADWNIVTQRFDSNCGKQTCAGGTGARDAGIVTTGTIAGNGAGAPVVFVGGTATTIMQWGAGSIPVMFTICSVTRYSGLKKQKILNCGSNPAGSKSWFHGHWAGNAGSTSKFSRPRVTLNLTNGQRGVYGSQFL